MPGMNLPERYRKWCKRKGYYFSDFKAADLYIDSIGHITTLPKNSNTRLIITTAAKELTSAKATLAVLRAEMDRLARQLPEYETVQAMYGVGEKTAPQLMAEIGDVRRFPRRSSIVSFAGVDPAVDESGKHVSKSNPTTKRGSPHLRKTLEYHSSDLPHHPVYYPRCARDRLIFFMSGHKNWLDGISQLKESVTGYCAIACSKQSACSTLSMPFRNCSTLMLNSTDS